MTWTILRTRTFSVWFEGLRDRRAQTIIAARIERVSFGNMGDVKPLGGGLQEIRIDYAAGYRVYFAVRGGQMIMLLAGGDKSSQTRDIAKARAMLAQEG